MEEITLIKTHVLVGISFCFFSVGLFFSQQDLENIVCWS